MRAEAKSTTVQGGTGQVHRGIGAVLILLIAMAIAPVAVVYTFGLPVPFTAAVVAGYAVQMGIVIVMAIHWRIQPQDPWIGIALVYGILQAVTLYSVGVRYGSYDPMDLVGAIAGMIGIVAYAGLFCALRPSERELRTFLAAFLWLTFAAIIVNFALNAPDIPQIFNAGSSYQFDFRGFFANRNQFGYFLFLGLVAHALHLHGRRPQVHNVLLFCLQFSSLLLTMSRASIAASLIFITVFAVLRVRVRARHLVMLVVTAAVGAVLVVRSEAGDALRDLLLRPDAALSGRDDIWNIGLDIWRESGVLLGSGKFRGIAIAQERGMEPSEFHSFFVETLVGGGLAELILVLVIVVMVWVRLARSPLDSGRRHVLCAALVGVVGLSFVESVSLFTVGLVGTIFTVFFISLPLLYAGLRPSPAGGASQAA
ncbi:O-antigen ligase family protein [Brevibacterium sp.]|uniref:O-antigen ligase family protein n=1 Tax=Brevibacterium sp. TaxID=1701 RepID=UPI002810F38E|nr:O-antigen ligase family protein [Brevibacterium sp.]